MELLVAFLARHGLHAALNFALWANWKPISFPTIFMCLVMLLSIPLGDFATKRAVVLIRVCQNLRLLLFDLLFFLRFLCISAHLSHHHAIYTSLLETFLTLGVIITSPDDFINLSIASEALNPWLYRFEYVARLLCINFSPFIIDTFQSSNILFYDLVALDIFKIVLLFEDNLLRVNVNFHEFDKVRVQLWLLVGKKAVISFRLFLD